VNSLSFDDILLIPKLGILEHRKDASLKIRLAKSINIDLPFLSAPMPAVTEKKLADEMNRLGGAGIIHRFMTKEEQFEHINGGFNWAATGIDKDRVDYLYRRGVRRFCLDIAHAHSDSAGRFLNWAKTRCPYSIWIAGNVATAEGAEFLEENGADAVKVGIGPGSACTTRIVTGFGVPQLTAIKECYDAVSGPTTIIADGGIRNSGDIVKCLAFGADAVMIGGLFAKALEAPNNGTYYGAASSKVNRHRAPEGIEFQISGEREPLEDIVKRLAWGVRSGISYAGGTCISDLREAEYIILSPGAQRESFSRDYA